MESGALVCGLQRGVSFEFLLSCHHPQPGNWELLLGLLLAVQSSYQISSVSSDCQGHGAVEVRVEKMFIFLVRSK